MEKPSAKYQRAAASAEAPPHEADDRATSDAARERWDSALDNPEARAFLQRAMKRRERMEREGLIRRP